MNFGRYEVVSEIGRGSMGVVYQAHDPKIDRRVALKVLRQDRVSSEDYVKRFLKEATAVGRLSHRGIVTVFDIGQDHGTIYIAMELLEGTPLDELIKQQKIDTQLIIKIGKEVAEALHYAHLKGIVHRDIKPANIICLDNGEIKVTDFGIAHIEDPDGQQMTQAGEILGTPVYMSPEQVLGQPVDGRSDIYSLGVILYELSTGRRPFKAGNLATLFNAITNDPVVQPASLNPKTPQRFSTLIMKAMARDPGDRYSSGEKLAQDILHASETAVPVPVKNPGTSMKTWLIALLTILIGSTTGILYYLDYLPLTFVTEKTSIEQSKIEKKLPEEISTPEKSTDIEFSVNTEQPEIEFISKTEEKKTFINVEEDASLETVSDDDIFVSPAFTPEISSQKVTPMPPPPPPIVSKKLPTVTPKLSKPRDDYDSDERPDGLSTKTLPLNKSEPITPPDVQEEEDKIFSIPIKNNSIVTDDNIEKKNVALPPAIPADKPEITVTPKLSKPRDNNDSDERPDGLSTKTLPLDKSEPITRLDVQEEEDKIFSIPVKNNSVVTDDNIEKKNVALPPAIPADTPKITNRPTDHIEEPQKTIIASLPPAQEKPQKLTLVIMNSRPQGASIYVDGDFIGKTPTDFKVSAIRHEVMLQLPGHGDWKAQLDLSKGGEIPLSIRLLPK